MNKEEMICKNCKYHYIEEISFDYPQSCCSKRMATTEEWCKCNDFEYDNRYIELLQQKNKQLQKELEEYKNPIKYFKYANKNVVEENKQLKDKLEFYSGLELDKTIDKTRLEYNKLLKENKKYKEVINKANKKLNNFIECCKAEKLESCSDYIHHQYWDMFERFNKQIKDILKEVE